jgi:hypothetical protein
MRVLALVYLLVARCSDEKFACAFHHINSPNGIKKKRIEIMLIDTASLSTLLNSLEFAKMRTLFYFLTRYVIY